MKKLKRLKKWIGILLLIVLFRVFVFEVYTIPSQSMMGTLLPGDIVFASKLHFGSRFNMITALRRTSGFSEPKRGNIVIFNFPEADTVYSFNHAINYHSNYDRMGREKALNDQSEYGPLIALGVLDRPTFVKRIIALPGDTVHISSDSVMVNNKLQILPQQMNRSATPGMLSEETQIESNKRLKEYQEKMSQRKDSMMAAFRKKETQKHKEIPFKKPRQNYRWIFPHKQHIMWDEENVGPLVIPRKGASVALDTFNICIYAQIIRNHEHHKLQVKGGVVYIDDKPATSYTFEKDYYYTLGDFRGYSSDSRYWGFLPDDHIKAKVTTVLFNTKYYNFSSWSSRILKWVD